MRIEREAAGDQAVAGCRGAVTEGAANELAAQLTTGELGELGSDLV